MPSPKQSVRVVIEGRVQGVWYRGWTVETAQALACTAGCVIWATAVSRRCFQGRGGM